MKMFMSDNNSGVHPKIMEAIVQANFEHDFAYGNDNTSKLAIEKIQQIFEKDVDVYFVTTGTASNVVGLTGLLKSYEAVVCANSAHINVDECGSLERLSGAKILQIPSKDGKITTEEVKKFFTSIDDQHQSQPRIISISQITETGILYTIDEIKTLSDFAHENNMLLHIDGARIANAIVALNTTFKEMITDTGVDLLSFGGTKNGMMIGEAVICFNKELSKGFKFYRKQGMQLLSKMRFVTAQFLAYLEEDLWKKNALNANIMGKYLANSLKELEGVSIKNQPDANMLFANMPSGLIAHLQEKFMFYVMDEETGLVRLVTSFDTNKEDIDSLIQHAKEYYI